MARFAHAALALATAIMVTTTMGVRAAAEGSGQAAGAAAGQSSAAAETVKAAELKRYEALTKNDLTTLATLLADDLTYVHSSGQPDSKTTYIETLRSGRTRYNTIEPGSLKVRVYGNTAIITGTMKMLVTSNGEQRTNHLIFTDVWVQRDKTWQMVSWQSTRQPEK